MDTKMSNTLKFLSVDMIENANSGHPGVAMDLSDILTVLSKHLIHNPKQPKWINRDRLIFSGGHASALIYSFLHLCGYNISMEDLKKFRQLDSNTPGHPEYGLTDGIEATTGPLGQGIANAVGLSMASLYARKILGSEIINHQVYCFCGDGDLQEGISYEACSIAGVHQLDNLILIYDCNNITIEGSIDIAFNENVESRFKSQGWEVMHIDGHDFTQIDNALKIAKAAKKPFLIIANTVIGKGAIGLEGSKEIHGAPLGEKITAKSKSNVNFNSSERFIIPEDVKASFRGVLEVGEMHYKIWEDKLNKSNCKNILHSLQNPNFENIIYPTFTKPISTRASNGEILNAISEKIEGFIGGSADLGPSNNTIIKNSLDFPNGKNFHFGVREHAMGAISNGISSYGLFIPFCATFFVFSDYMSAAVRIASISKLKMYFIWTHDSIGVGEDGATHQPIEQLSHFRAMPNLLVFRPSDANENIECWKVALKQNTPCAFVLSRQNLPLIEGEKNCSKGAYVVLDSNNPKVIIIASGSEVHLALEASKELKKDSIESRIISAPCYDLLIKQDNNFLSNLFNPKVKVIALEASRGLEWYRFADIVISMDTFGASGKMNDVFNKFGFSVLNVVKIIKDSI